MFELGARPYTPRDLYTAYLQQSHIFIGIYWQNYGWVAPDMNISGLEDEFQLSADMPRLMYIKEPSPERSPELKRMIGEIGQSGVSYKSFKTLDELKSLVINDLSILFTERFESSLAGGNLSLESDVLNEEFPVPPMPMIGREMVVTSILDLLHNNEVRLLTLSGTGGMGKTRVALEVIRRYKSAGYGLVCFIPLANVDQSDNVPSAILRKAFPAAKTEGSSMQLLIDLFKNKKVLLVLDNFEHLIEARLTVSELLQHCPDLRILVTSRELLHISGEFEFALQPLELASADQDFKSLHQIPTAVELFIQRSKNIKFSFELNEENYRVIREICFLLDGIPLAIELAAARTRLLSPSQILNLLKKSLNVLKAENHDMPDRHQTLKATVDWSFALLTPAEQRTISMLSVFAGGGSLEAASLIGSDNEYSGDIWAFPRKGFYLSECIENVLRNDINEVDFLESAESLLTKSLMFTSVDQQGLLRMNFYQTIRHYCLEKLREFGLEQLAFKKHLLYYLYLAEHVWSKLRSEDAESSYITLDNDLNNIESALQWSVANEPLAGLRLALAMAEYWDTRNRSGESCFWLEKLLAANAHHEDANFEIFCLARMELSRAKFRIGEFDQSWNLAVDCLKQSKEKSNVYFMTDALVIQSLINVYAHRNELKDEILEEAIARATSVNYKMALLDCYQFKSADKIFSGFATEGISWAKESLQLAKQLMAKRWEAIAHIFLGFGYLQVGSFTEAKDHFRNALICTQNLSDQLLPVYSILGLGQIALATQQIQKGCMYLGVLDAFYSKPGAAFVPIVHSMYTSTLEHLKSLGLEHLDILMDEGRKVRLNEAIQMAMEDHVENPSVDVQSQVEEAVMV
ncbi:MAG: hypothetical protein IPI60_09260 [Saprospiraceae bacterium]|nr:hypothetical protein [Saprospiraceae bacterium]